MSDDAQRSCGAADDLVWDQWRREFPELELGVQDLVLNDAVFRLSMEALKRLPAERRNFVYSWLVATYARDCDVGIRRVLDTSCDAVSLGRLLEELRTRPHIVTVDRFQRSYPEGLRDSASMEFESLVGKGRVALTREMVDCDQAIVEEVFRDSGLKRLTDWRIAHHIPGKALDRIPTWKQVHDCIAALERICLRYRFLLLQQDNRTLLPANMEDVEEAIVTFWLGERLDDPGSLLRTL